VNTHKQILTFASPVFKRLANAQRHNVKTSHAGCNTARSRNVEQTGRSNFHPK